MKATQTNKYIVAWIAVSAVFAFIGGFFVNVNKEVPMDTKPLKAAEYRIPPSEAHKYQQQFNVSFGSVAHADAMTAREQILNYPWDEVYTRSQSPGKKYKIQLYKIDKIKFYNFYHNQNNFKKLFTDQSFSTFLQYGFDGTNKNGEIVRVTYYPTIKEVTFLVDFPDRNDKTLLALKVNDKSHNHIMELIRTNVF